MSTVQQSHMQPVMIVCTSLLKGWLVVDVKSPSCLSLDCQVLTGSWCCDLDVRWSYHWSSNSSLERSSSGQAKAPLWAQKSSGNLVSEEVTTLSRPSPYIYTCQSRSRKGWRRRGRIVISAMLFPLLFHCCYHVSWWTRLFVLCELMSHNVSFHLLLFE